VLVLPPILAPAVWAGLKYDITRKVRSTPYDPAPLAAAVLKYTYLQNFSMLLTVISVQKLFFVEK
jgi:hypothetical protein